MSDDLIVFAEDTVSEPVMHRQKPWKILIVDDEDSIHQLTKRVLSGIEFDNRTLEFLDAYSGKETMEFMRTHDDIAIILLDVVMETDDAGLQAVKYIRTELDNQFTRIILRTGQPGHVPEKKVINDYDINDYKEKTELTATKLYTTIISSLRDYNLLRIVDRNRKGLERILESSRDISRIKAFGEFAEGLLTQIISLLKMEEDSLYLSCSGFTAEKSNGKYTILAGTGEYSLDEYKNGSKPLPLPIQELLEHSLSLRESFFDDDVFVGYVSSEDRAEVRLLYLNGCRWLTSIDRRLIHSFVENMSISFDNIFCNKRVNENTQLMSSMIGYLMGQLHDPAELEISTDRHRRIGAMSGLLAMYAGLDAQKQDMIRLGGVFGSFVKTPLPDSDEFFSHEAWKGSPLVNTASEIAQFCGVPWSDGQIPIAAQIVAICVAIDNAMIAGLNPLDAIIANRGTMFDPVLCDLVAGNHAEFVRIRQQ